MADLTEWRRSYAEIKKDPELRKAFLDRKRRERKARQGATGSETLRKQQWRAANREKALAIRKASHAVDAAILKGALVRPAQCSHCGCSGKIEAHHFLGYAPEHRLDIVWLCEMCHHAKHPHPRRKASVLTDGQ